jgi:adenosylcobinamide-phosphate synthase
LIALGLDYLFGEPPDRWHPVRWIGRAFEDAERSVGDRGARGGALALGAVTALAWGSAAIVGRVGRRLGWLGLLLEGAALKPAFALTGLAAAAEGVGEALRAGDLVEARRRVGRDLVSRETSGLSRGEVTSAAVESVAENLTDSVAGPLLAYAVGGLPGAWAYRAINTADAMWGYHGPRYERFGKPAARLDDAANLVPAPVAAAAIATGAAVVGEDGKGAWRLAWRDHGRTASPNAGWPMAAMAGALGVGLEKPGHYRIGDSPVPESAETIRRAVRVLGTASLLVAGTALLVACLRRGR